MEQAKFDVDLLVVGGGLGGLTAGLRACELGRSVMIAEKGTTQDYPCNSRYSGGIFHVAYHEMKAAPDVLENAVRAVNPEVDAAQVAAIAGVAGRVMDWLQAQGAKFMRASAIDWHRWAAAPPRLLRPGLAEPSRGRGVDVVMRRLTEKLTAGGGALLLGHRVSGLEITSGGFSVLLTQDDGRERRVQSRCVVIADGGIAGNLDLLKAHISPRPDLIVQRNAGTSLGDGLRLAKALGAKVTALNRFYGHLLHRDALKNPELWPYPQIDTVATAGIVVGADGRRFTDEARGGVYISNQVAALADPLSATAIFDETIWNTAGRQSLYPVNPHVETYGGKVLRAGSIEELARQLSIPADALSETVAGFNAAVAAKNGERIAPQRSGQFNPIASAPYMAIPLAAGITHAMGGLLVDGHARVLDEAGAPIKGLYAVGTATGGLDGGEAIAYAGGLVKAAGLGLLAAEHASEVVAA